MAARAVCADFPGETGAAATENASEVPLPVNPQENRIKATAVLFLTVSLFLVRGAHATVQASTDCTITGTPGPDQILGTPGRDVICGLGGDDVLAGAGGNDVLVGGPGKDMLNGGDGADVLEGEAGPDMLNGGNGADVLRGGPGSDKLSGDSGRDVVFGGDGNDTIFAWDGFADRLDGGAGVDRVWKDKYDHVAHCERYS
jgi:Ca2+-binding RTX toxin-like protein